MDFNPRSSCEERRPDSGKEHNNKLFQSTLLMRGATASGRYVSDCTSISIHAPHARSDRWYNKAVHADDDFNPRSSCEERPDYTAKPKKPVIFQSTLLMRGATRSGCGRSKRSSFQSTLLMRGATHAAEDSAQPSNFNPRSSCEERRADVKDVSQLQQNISIHAPHARSDATSLTQAARLTDFNPRSSCEERLMQLMQQANANIFQSTLLMRGATHAYLPGRQARDISIHAPHARSDTNEEPTHDGFDISIHAPHARSDCINFRH